MRENLLAHIEFSRRLFRLGMPLVALWGTREVRGARVCRCWKGQECVVPGKHPCRSSVAKSLIPSEEVLVEHINKEGNLGLVLFYDLPGVPPCPLRFVAFDDDDGTGLSWLEERGISSPWVVMGTRGSHSYGLLPEGVPDLITRYAAFKPNPPKMDVKTSGLMVLPMDNGKQLFVDGQRVTVETIHLLDRFNSLEELRSWLPKVDPRTVIPGMKVREPKPPVTEQTEKDAWNDGDDGTAPLKPKKKRRAGPLYLSIKCPTPDAYHPRYTGIPYYERQRFAENHAKKVLPSVEGKDPWGKLLKVVSDCMHHYGMSDKSTWEIVRDYFNPRCRHEDGQCYPWKKRHVSKAIVWAHQDGGYSTMATLEKLADPEKVIARLKRQGEKANARRKVKSQKERCQREGSISIAMEELGYVAASPQMEQVAPERKLREGVVSFVELYEELQNHMADQGRVVPSKKLVGEWLGRLGLETYAGRIRTKNANAGTQLRFTA